MTDPNNGRDPRTVTVVAIFASHNRLTSTMTAISSLRNAADVAAVELRLVCFDDGSSDGTADTLRDQFECRVLEGDGSAFWAAGMAAADRAAEADPDWDVLLWINDDVVLDADAVQRGLEVIGSGEAVIAVGAFRGTDGAPTYGGFRKVGMHPLSFERLTPGASSTLVDAFNGNFVMMGRHVRERIGAIDGGYPHALADIDYGARATRVGVRMRTIPGTVGVCDLNSSARSTALRDWKKFVGRKGGGNAKGMTRYILRNASPFHLVFLPITYALWWIRRGTSK